jgi:amino acid transporter
LFSGWLCFTGWQAAIVAIAYLAGSVIQGLITLNNTDYAAPGWQGTLLIMGISTFSIVFNTFLAKKLPLVEGMILVLHILGLFIIIIPLWVLAPRNNAKAVFTEFSSLQGWEPMGLSVMVGLLTTVVSMLGFDCAVHMCKFIMVKPF